MLNDLAEKINQAVSSAKAIVQTPEAETLQSSIKIESDSLLDVCRFLKESVGFNVLQVISGVDYLERNVIEVCYMLANFEDASQEDIIVKVELDRGDDNNLPKIDSVVSLWSSANWLERETYDLVGVEFVGHPDQRRILCPYDWQGHPLRKDYVVQEEYNGMLVNPPEKINNDDHFFGQKIIEQAADPKKIAWSWKDKVKESEA